VLAVHFGDIAKHDSDSNGVPDISDNCLGVSNGQIFLDPDDAGISQRNSDNDGQGDACDGDPA